ncbi:MAG: 6-bladed beta-propeller [Planctomycetota bacterium]
MKRRNFLASSSALAAANAFSRVHVSANDPKPNEVVGHGEFRYRVIRDWAQINPLNTPLLNCHEMVQDRRGRLIMMGDHTQNNVLIFDRSGELVDSWGTMFPGGHGLTHVDEGDDEFLLLTDAGWRLDESGQSVLDSGRVTKTTLKGRVIFDIAHPQTIGIYEPGTAFGPTETAVAPNGDIYVADGYGQDYILQYDSNGRYIRHWGGRKNQDKNYNLINAHGVAVDTRDPSNPELIVTSRAQCCFKHFTLDGKWLRTVQLPNMRICRPVIDESNVYAGVCWSTPKGGGNTHGSTGFVTVLEGDRVVSNPGGTSPEYIDGELRPSFQINDAPIMHGHDVCVDRDKNLFVCQWNANQTPPLLLERV